jgi:prepilin-type N-terminal cleavage/methylation domain-containing protein
MKQQKGFTLVEMAIVLVIIGLLLGGVLKGQELIENSRIKNAIKDLGGISAAYNAYFDRFHQMPGDDGSLATLTARGGNWVTVTLAGNVNGVLDVALNQTFNGSGEAGAFFAHNRAAGFLSGNPALPATVATLPRNAFGGLTGITSGSAYGFPANGRYVCMGSVPGKSARAIDASMDDGVLNTGSLRGDIGLNNAIPTATAAATANYDDGQTYTICTFM